MVRNTYIYPPGPSMRIVSDIIAYTTAAHAEVQSDLDLRLSHAGSRRDGGPRACLHARRRPRIRARRLGAGLDVDQFAPRLSFFFGHRHELLHGGRQAARGAAALGQADEERFEPKDERSLSLRTHCQTSGWSLAAQDPFNNVVRTAIEAMAATQGGTQSLHTNALDEALALPTDFSARIARNTQLFLQTGSRHDAASSIRGAARSTSSG